MREGLESLKGRGVPCSNGLVVAPGVGPQYFPDCACLLSGVCLGLGERKAACDLSTRLTLRGDYDVWRREELRSQLQGVEVAGDVTIDLSGVTLMDAGSAALLIALKRRVNERDPNARVILLDTPRIVKRVLDLCGASGLFVFSVDR